LLLWRSLVEKVAPQAGVSIRFWSGNLLVKPAFFEVFAYFFGFLGVLAIKGVIK